VTDPALPPGPEPPVPEPPTPLADGSGPPADIWVRPKTADGLAWWIFDHRASFTDDALERAAIAAGYSVEAYRSARDRVDARIASTEALRPVRSSAKRLVILAYAAVWAAFGLAFLSRADAPYSYAGPLHAVLTVALIIGLAVSLLIIRRGRPEAGRPGRALLVFLAMPVILLIGVAGLCLPTAVTL